MQILTKLLQSKSLHSIITLILISSSICIIYLFVSLLLVFTSQFPYLTSISQNHNYASTTTLHHIVFGIASSNKSWQKRQEFVKLWWKQQEMRGCVFLEEKISDKNNNTTQNAFLPPVCISEDTSRFRYTHRHGLRSAIRVARVVSETVRLNYSEVRWFVFGDDDTVFFPENLVKVLSKYDHELWYYIGSNSEIYEQNRIFGFEMAYGGGGFAISYGLAKVLAKVFDSCIERYPHLYGSDSRISSCLAELGVGLTREPGFHQVDLTGDIYGLLTAHPLSSIVSLHHLDHINPIFPNRTKLNALQHLFKAASVDSQRLLQKTVCYDNWFSWTISVSWGYAIEVYNKPKSLPDILPTQTTFKQWKKGGGVLSSTFTFNVRPPHPAPCLRPVVFFLDHLSSDKDGLITSHYKKNYVNCSYDMSSPRNLELIKVFSHKLDLSHKKLQAPRRQCCDVLPSSAGNVLEIAIRECGQEELIRMPMSS